MITTILFGFFGFFFLVYSFLYVRGFVWALHFSKVTAEAMKTAGITPGPRSTWFAMLIKSFIALPICGFMTVTVTSAQFDIQKNVFVEELVKTMLLTALQDATEQQLTVFKDHVAKNITV